MATITAMLEHNFLVSHSSNSSDRYVYKLYIVHTNTVNSRLCPCACNLVAPLGNSQWRSG